MGWLQTNVALALAAAALWGTGDFAGGMAVKRAGGTVVAALRILVLSHAASLIVLLAIAGLRRDPFPHGPPFFWAILAGIAGGLSLTAFYIALSRGAMGASAAVSGLLAAALPAMLSSYLEGFPGLLRLAGFATAGLAIVLIASAPSAASPGAAARGTMPLAIAAGGGFGVYFIALKFASPGGLLWPMALARVGSLTTSCLLLLGLALFRPPGTKAVYLLPRAAVLWALLTAAGDTSGNLLFLAATRSGRLDIAAVLASLYPASTILLAGALLKERPTRRQLLGMAVATSAIVMITR